MIKEYSDTYLRMLRVLDTLKDEEYMKSFLLYNTSLICVGLKPAVTLTLMSINERNLDDLWLKYGSKYIDELNLNYKILKESKDRTVLIIYNYNLMKECLNKKLNAEFLEDFGYSEELDVDEKIELLRKRYEICNCPHELGIFLGYPVDDVNAFIEHNKVQCKKSGYWKVYGSVEDAEKIFALFDKVKNNAAENIIKGLTNRCSLATFTCH